MWIQLDKSLIKIGNLLVISNLPKWIRMYGLINWALGPWIIISTFTFNCLRYVIWISIKPKVETLNCTCVGFYDKLVSQNGWCFKSNSLVNKYNAIILYFCNFWHVWEQKLTWILKYSKTKYLELKYSFPPNLIAHSRLEILSLYTMNYV